MWTKNNDGSISWSEEAKLTLIKLLEQNMAAISNQRLNPRKPAAWEKVYKALIKAGMPKTSVDRVKKCWSRMFLAAKSQPQLRSNAKLKSFSKLDTAVKILLQKVDNYDDCLDNMPKVSFSINYCTINISTCSN